MRHLAVIKDSSPETHHVAGDVTHTRFRGVEEGKARDMRRRIAASALLAIAVALGASNAVAEPSTYAGTRTPLVVKF